MSLYSESKDRKESGNQAGKHRKADLTRQVGRQNVRSPRYKQTGNKQTGRQADPGAGPLNEEQIRQ